MHPLNHVNTICYNHLGRRPGSCSGRPRPTLFACPRIPVRQNNRLGEFKHEEQHHPLTGGVRAESVHVHDSHAIRCPRLAACIPKSRISREDAWIVAESHNMRSDRIRITEQSLRFTRTALRRRRRGRLHLYRSNVCRRNVAGLHSTRLIPFANANGLIAAYCFSRYC